MIEAVFIACAALIVLHHAGYPWLLSRLSGRGKAGPVDAGSETARSLTLIVPVYNEQGIIAAKLDNLRELDYPREQLRIIVALDGCTDNTAALAQAWLRTGDAPWIEVVDFPLNRGKTAVLNELVSAATSEIVALSDASTILAPDALLRAQAHFADAEVGFMTGRYTFDAAIAPGEDVYWDYQTRIKAGEAALGAPMGAHGAFYAFRRDLWSPLEADTINDDFILPMRIVAQGFRGVYDTELAVIEKQASGARVDFRRRIRIAAGNVQQVFRLWRLLDPRRPGLAFSFFGGKALRAFMPLLMVAALLSNAWLALSEGGAWFALFMAQVAGYGAAVLGLALGERAPGVFAGAGYLVAGHAAGLIGAARYIAGGGQVAWGRPSESEDQLDYAPPMTRLCKRVFDILCALCALVVLAIVFVPIALAIKLDSRGPIFYRQLRVGQATARATRLFWLTKFRTMRVDAEAQTGAVWAAKNDPRVTRVGRFLRKSRLDELPQAWNVLVGEMSVVGPRPERPQFFHRLETEIPFYIERTFGLKPGITGLAQVSQGYDESVEDVRSKVLFDHAYALQISRPLRWFVTDVSIVFRTVSTMVLGKGQ